MTEAPYYTVDVERLTSAYLRDDPDIITIVGTRVYTEPPQRATFPLLRIQQIGGAPITSRPLYLDSAFLQVDCYGGPKALGRRLMDRARWLMSTEPYIGAHALGVITGCEFGDARYLPDDDYDPPHPRWIFEASVYSHPL